jgi:hypothetical protein
MNIISYLEFTQRNIYSSCRYVKTKKREIITTLKKVIYLFKIRKYYF